MGLGLGLGLGSDLGSRFGSGFGVESSWTPRRAKMKRMRAKRPSSWLTASIDTRTASMIFCRPD